MKGEYFQVQVETYDGHKGAERPKSFVWKERRIECREIIDRWYGENHEYFKTNGDDGRIYILRYDREDDFWEISSVAET
jgi:hypothetical protein